MKERLFLYALVVGSAPVALLVTGCPGGGGGSGFADAGDGGDFDAGTIANVGCDPRFQECDQAPDGCMAATTEFCARYNNGELLVSGGDRVPMPGSFHPNSSACQAYYEFACTEGCPEWDLDSCVAAYELREEGVETSCKFVTECENVFETECPTTALSACAAYNRGELAVPGQCRAWYEGECHQGCVQQFADRLSLQFCRADGGQANVGDACRAYVDEGCANVVETNCPSESPRNCATPERAPELCVDRLIAQCGDDWRDRLCPEDLGMEITTQSCTHEFDALNQAAHRQCRGWLRNTCETMIETAAEEELDGNPDLCMQDTAIPDSPLTPLLFEMTDGVSLTDTYDCMEPELGTLGPNQLRWLAREGMGRPNDPDGNRVFNCNEFAFQTFWQWKHWQRATSTFEDDPRRAMDLAYSDDPELSLATKAMNDGEDGLYPFGNPTVPEWGLLRLFNLPPQGTRFVRKNDFFQIPDELDAALKSAVEDPDLAAWLNNRPLTVPPTIPTERGPDDGWHWHQDMSDALASYDDEELLYLYAARKRFVELKRLFYTNQELIEDAWDNAGEPQFVNGILIIPQGVVAAIERQGTIVDDLLALLAAAYEHPDCLTGNGTGPCDWSPQDFVDDVNRMFDEFFDQARERCLNIVDWDQLAEDNGSYEYLDPNTGNWPSNGGWLSETGARQNPGKLEEYIERKYVTEQLRPQYLEYIATMLPEDETPIWGQSWNRSNDFGDRSYFYAGYELASSWSYNPDVAWCEPDVEAAANATIQVDVFAIDQSEPPPTLFDARYEAGLRDRYLQAGMTLLGDEIWVEEGSRNPADVVYDWNIVYESEPIEREFGRPCDIFAVPPTCFEIPVFSIAGFNLVLSAGAAGAVGLNYGGELTAEANYGNCTGEATLSLSNTVTPYAKLEGFIQFGIDLFIVEAGVGGALEFVNVSLPSNFDIGLAGQLGDANDLRLEVDIDVDFVLSTLSGYLYVYVDTFWDTYRKTVFDWDGPEWTRDVMTREFDFRLADVAAVLDCNDSSCN